MGFLNKKCEHCGIEFIVKDIKRDRNRIFCSADCRIKSKKYNSLPRILERVEKTCQVCNKIFLVKASRADKAKYCSKECYDVKRGLSKEKNPMWKGGVIYDPFGYKLVRVDMNYPGVHSNGYIRNCRYVWQETTGEVLKTEEVIHHINCDKTDDSFENLQKFANQAEHIRIGHGGRSERGD